MKSGFIVPLALGILLGFGIGVTYAWVIGPVEYVDTAPNSLREDFRSDYLALIASAYAGTGDLLRARARLELFSDPDMATTLAALAQQRLAAGWPGTEIQAIAQLASDLRGGTSISSTAPSGQSVADPPTVTATLRATPTSRPSSTPRPSPTAGLPFEVLEVVEVCNPDLTQALLQVEVLDASEQPVSGVEIIVFWDDGQDRFFTGLKPELGFGYADFELTEGVSYSLQLVDLSPLVSDLVGFQCSLEDGTEFTGSWLVTFKQPVSSP